MGNPGLEKYILLIEAFIDKRITTATFEKEYLHLFKNEKISFGDEVFKILNNVFMDVDALCIDKNLFEDENDIDENELRKRCIVSLDKLYQV